MNKYKVYEEKNKTIPKCFANIPASFNKSFFNGACIAHLRRFLTMSHQPNLIEVIQNTTSVVP